MADFEFITVAREGRLTILTMNRPDVMNAVHAPMHREMGEALDAFAADPEQWVAIITGAGGRAFSAGNDLKATAAGADLSWPDAGFGGITNRWDLAKPVIAAVNGIAMGGGFEIALACDLIIAADNALFALPEPKVGLAALAGGMHRLPREIGLKRAMGMMLTARRVGAAEGKELGFVNEVVPAAELMDAARRWAGMILECGPMSVRATKEAAMKGLDEPSLRAALEGQAQYPAVRALYRSEDFKEGPKAFAEKRQPNWQGR